MKQDLLLGFILVDPGFVCSLVLLTQHFRVGGQRQALVRHMLLLLLDLVVRDPDSRDRALQHWEPRLRFHQFLRGRLFLVGVGVHSQNLLRKKDLLL